MKKFVLLVLFVTCVLSIATKYVFASNNEKIVEMTDEGFSPPEVNVEVNSTISFINKDKKDHWPASDLHPTHGIYPEFDPRRPIHPGETWQFKAEKVGIWKFHDHLYPHRKGMLIVTGNAKVKGDSASIWTAFLRGIENFFSSVFKNFSLQKIQNGENSVTIGADYKNLQDRVEKEGIEATWKDLVATYSSGGTLKNNPHDLAHFMGGLIYDKKGLQGLNVCTPDFAFGCYHGLLDKAFLSGIEKLNEAERACLLVGPAGSGPFSSCIHGIGHGVASFYKTIDLNSALSTCDTLTQGQTYCYDGVLMEFARNAPTSFYKTDNPLYPCDSIGQKYLSACGRNQPSVLFDRLKLSFDTISQICISSPNLEFKMSCFDALGFNVANRSGGSAEVIVAECNKIGQTEAQSRCVAAAAGELVFQNIAGWQESTIKVCKSLLPKFQKDCHERVQQIVVDYNRES